MARKVGTATKKLLPDIAGPCRQRREVRQGECIFEKNAHTFVLEAVPGGLAKKLATALQAETGQKYKSARAQHRWLDGTGLGHRRGRGRGQRRPGAPPPAARPADAAAEFQKRVRQ